MMSKKVDNHNDFLQSSCVSDSADNEVFVGACNKVPGRERLRRQSSSSMSEVDAELSELSLNELSKLEESQSLKKHNHKCYRNRYSDDAILDLNGRTRSLYGASPNCKFGPKASIMKSQAAVLTIQDPRSQRLTWYKPPLSVLVIKKIFDGGVIDPYVQLISWLIEEKKMVVFVETKSHEELKEHTEYKNFKTKLCTFKEGEDDLTDKIDFIICLGGDGTLLYASSLFQQSVPPVMAFYWGSLGFLTPFNFSSFQEDVTQVLEGNAALMLRTRLKAVVIKNGTTEYMDENISLRDVESKQHNLVLNEVVVGRGACPYITNIELYIEQRYVTCVQGDGLIIATPTGSTAYAAAAGASMVHPNVPAILITPICPHSLSFRPIVVPAGVEIKIRVSPDSRDSAFVSFDGRNRIQIDKGDIVRISTSIYPVPSICRKDQISDWFDTLVGCMNWNERKTQNSFSMLADDSLFSPNASEANSSSNGNLTE